MNQFYTNIGSLAVAGHRPLYKNDHKYNKKTPYITQSQQITLYNSMFGNIKNAIEVKFLKTPLRMSFLKRHGDRVS